MGIIEEMAKAKAFDKMQAQKQYDDSIKAAQLNGLMDAQRERERIAREKAMQGQAHEQGMASMLNGLIDAGMFQPPKPQPKMKYNVGPDGVPVPVDQNTTSGLADTLGRIKGN